MARRNAKHRTAPAAAETVRPADLLRQASTVLASDPAQAETLARQALDADPGSVDARSVLGAALRRKGDPRAALAVLTRLTAAKSCPWIVHFELAQAQLAIGQSRAAVAPLRRVVELNPDWTPAWRMLGDIAMASCDFPSARLAYDRRISSMIRDPQLKAAADALIDERLDDAERELRAVLAQKPPAPAAAEHLLAEVTRRRGRFAQADEMLRRCLKGAPDFYQARQSLAQTLLGGRRFVEAIAELDQLLTRDPTDNRSLMTKASALTAIDRFEEAATAYATVLERFPDQSRTWHVHANGLRTIGRIEECIAAYRKCIELDPGFAEPYWSLSNLKTYRFSPDQVAEMQSMLARDDLPPKDKTELCFALGKAHEDAGAYEEAFEHYARGNAVERARRSYDANATSEHVRRVKALFTSKFFAQRKGWGVSDDDPIFIVSLPRSGSTLVDQILSSHPQIEGTRELPEIPLLAERVKRYPNSLTTFPNETFIKLGREYLRQTQPVRMLERPHFTDKTPGNLLHIALIHLILPNARIVDVRRHPLACCMSGFKQHFARGFVQCFDLTDLGRYYADYVELMTHFDDVLPGKVHRVIYEDLVADTETEVRRLLDYLGLPFDPACLRFFENRRAVATPSSEQVRQPIFDDALDQWRNFEPWLGPLKAALGPVLEAYPAVPAPSAG